MIHNNLHKQALCEKNEKQQNFCLSSRGHPPILLPNDFASIPCTLEDSLSQAVRLQEYLFCTQIKATSIPEWLVTEQSLLLTGGGVQQDNLCENGMANLSQSTESLQPLCAA